jgi:hypothetical protein
VGEVDMMMFLENPNREKIGIFSVGGQEMKPFQVNCSELIADFEVHKDEEHKGINNFFNR